MQVLRQEDHSLASVLLRWEYIVLPKRRSLHEIHVNTNVCVKEKIVGTDISRPLSHPQSWKD